LMGRGLYLAELLVRPSQDIQNSLSLEVMKLRLTYLKTCFSWLTFLNNLSIENSIVVTI
jgi:hypothetical protein